MRLSLEELLFSQAAQQMLLRQLATELEALSGTRPLDWLGNPMPAIRPQRKKPIQQTSADVLGAKRRRVFEAIPDVDYTETADNLRRLAESGDGLACTFMCLLALMVADNLVDIVARSTPQRVCDAYFTAKGGFETRMNAHLTGKMGYNGVSGAVLSPAEPSFITAVKEQLLLKVIISQTGA